MTQTSSDTLRRSLDQVDRERKRTTYLLFGLLAMTAAFWIGMILAKDQDHGLPFGLAAIMGTVYCAAMMAAKTSHENTRTILKAIELLARDGDDSGRV